jgi:hypothetical protein
MVKTSKLKCRLPLEKSKNRPRAVSGKQEWDDESDWLFYGGSDEAKNSVSESSQQ